MLEDALGHEVPSFADAHGFHCAQTHRVVHVVGYTSACAVMDAFSSNLDCVFSLARLTVGATTTPEVDGRAVEVLALHRIPRARTARRRVCTATHGGERASRGITDMHANGPAIRPIGRPATHQPKLETINMRTSVPGAFLDSVLRGALEAKAGTTRPTTVIAIGNLATSILEHCDTPRGLARQLRQSLASCQNHC